MLVAGFKRLLKLGRRVWLCGAQRRSLVCLGTVRPFFYAGGTPVPWHRLATFCGLGYALLLDYVDGYHGGVLRRMDFRPTTPLMQVLLWGLGCALSR
jgi:hypothetical protein